MESPQECSLNPIQDCSQGQPSLRRRRLSYQHVLHADHHFAVDFPLARALAYGIDIRDDKIMSRSEDDLQAFCSNMVYWLEKD